MKRFNNIYQDSTNEEVLKNYRESNKLLNTSKALDRLMLKLNKAMLEPEETSSFLELFEIKKEWAKNCIDCKLNDFIDSYKTYLALIRQVYFIRKDCSSVFTGLEKTTHLNNLGRADQLRRNQTRDNLREVMLEIHRTPLCKQNIYDSGGLRYAEYLQMLIRNYIQNNPVYLDLQRLVLDEVLIPLKFFDLVTDLYKSEAIITFIIHTDRDNYSMESCTLSGINMKNNVIAFGNNSMQYIKFCDSYFMYKSGELYGEVLGFY